jgi:hypothetical protein
VIPDIEIEIGRDAFNYCGDIPNIDIPERIRKTIKFSSSDEDEADDYEGQADGCEAKADDVELKEVDLNINVDELPF